MLIQVPLQVPSQPDRQIIGPFIEPEYDDDYYEEMYHNIDIEDPGPEWSDWGLNSFDSSASSAQDKSDLSFSGDEGYNQD
ncbi:hypothetical protein MKW98_029728, partial [Papaver atlanticum]